MSVPITKLVLVGQEYDEEEETFCENPQLKAAEWREAENLDILLTNGESRLARATLSQGADKEALDNGFGLWDQVFWGHDGYWRTTDCYIDCLLETAKVLEKHKVPFKVNDMTRYCYEREWPYKKMEVCKKFNKLFGVEEDDEEEEEEE